MKIQEIHEKIVKEHDGMLGMLSLTFMGFYDRLTSNSKYWEEITESDIATATHGISWIDEAIKNREETLESISHYAFALENQNSKLLNRSSFIVISLSVISLILYGTLKFEPFAELPGVQTGFGVYVFAVILALSAERLKVLSRVTANELLINLVAMRKSRNV